MGDHLKVDLSELAATARSLETLCQNFTGAAAQAEQAGEDLGSPELGDAMQTFASNWDYHKKKLVSELEALRDMADQSHQAYVGVDEQLAAALREASARPVGR